MNVYFVLDETPLNRKNYMLRPNFDNEEIEWTGLQGSWNVLPARVLGISYDTYLRFCRDELGARIVGKEGRYPYPYFQMNQATKDFLVFLNKNCQFGL